MKHKIAFIDMDGTLYQTENDIIQESTLASCARRVTKSWLPPDGR